jgi:glycosyltransferase involved in cell wall biosynthesis
MYPSHGEKPPLTSPSKRKNLRLLFVSTDRFPPYRVDVDVLFGREMIRRGHQIDWILQSGDFTDKNYHTDWRGCDVWVGRNRAGTSAWRRLVRHFDRIGNDMKMFRLTRERQYDCIQVRDKCISAVMGLLLARRRGLRFVYWLSWPFPDYSMYKGRTGDARYPLFYLIRGAVFSMVLYKLVMPRADHIFVQSEQMKRDMVGKGIPEHLMTAVPMGVSPETLEQIETYLDADTSTTEKKILYLGTLARERKIDIMIRILALVRQQVPNTRLYLVGAGNDQEDERILRSEAERLGVSDAVVFTGFLPMNEAWKYVASADVCISPFYPTPTLNSTSPTKLVEYMALGKAVVANDHPEQRLVINQSGAGLCVQYDENQFADATITLLKNPQQRELMGRNGRNYVLHKRSYKVIGDMVERTYLELFKKDEVV